jgi:hypothetical protein
MTGRPLLRQTLAFVCGASLLAATPFPSSAAPAPAGAPAAMIGTMSAVGSADVRGTRLREATLFSGDRVRALRDSYVKVVLTGGHRVELSADTEAGFARTGELTKVAMLSGRVGFAASPAESLEVDVQSLAVLADPGESGAIASVSANLVSISAIKGRMEVRNTATGESFTLDPGTSTVFGLNGREPAQNSGSSAAGRPDAQQTQQPPPNQEPATIRIPPPTTGSGKSASTKILIIAGVGGAGAAVAAILATRNGDSASPSTPR